MAAQDATEDEEAADEDLGDDVIPEDDDEAEVEDDENTELVGSCLVVLFVFHALVACIYGHLKSVVSNDQIPSSCLCVTTLSFFDKALKQSTFSAI